MSVQPFFRMQRLSKTGNGQTAVISGSRLTAGQRLTTVTVAVPVAPSRDAAIGADDAGTAAGTSTSRDIHGDVGL